MMHLSDFELEVMQLFWQQGELSAPATHERVSQRRDVTYSTVKTIIDRLEDKGAIKRVERHGRTIIYAATVAADDLRKPMIKDFIQRVFGGNRQPLFSHLLDDEDLSADDLRYLEQLLSDRRKDSNS